MYTKEQLERLIYFLCDPFLTVSECLKLAGCDVAAGKTAPVKSEDREELLAA